MKSKDIKILVGLYAAIMTMMGVNIPISVLSPISDEFPEVSETVVQMIVSVPGFLAIASNLLFSKLAYKFYKKHVAVACILLFVAGGLIPFFFHGSIIFLLLSSCLAGFAMGGVQNSCSALICDCFDGDKRTTVMGLSSVFIGMGGAILTIVASNLGAIKWYYAYLTFLCLVPLMILAIIFLPRGILEEKPTKSNRARISTMIKWCCVFGFFMYTVSQLFNSNISMLVSERGIGSTAMAGTITTIYTIAMMGAGLLVVPFTRIFHHLSIPALFLLCGLGCTLMMVGENFTLICIGAIVMSFAYGAFTPFVNSIVSQVSPAMGMSFNLALVSALCSLGQASSPITTGFVAGLFGGSTADYFGTGVAISLVLAVFTKFKCRNGESPAITQTETVFGAYENATTMR